MIPIEPTYSAIFVSRFLPDREATTLAIMELYNQKCINNNNNNIIIIINNKYINKLMIN